MAGHSQKQHIFISSKLTQANNWRRKIIPHPQKNVKSLHKISTIYFVSWLWRLY